MSSDGVELSIDLGAASVSFDQKGKIIEGCLIEGCLSSVFGTEMAALVSEVSSDAAKEITKEITK